MTKGRRWGAELELCGRREGGGREGVRRRRGAPGSLHAAGRALGAAAHGRAHGFGRDQVQVLVVRDLVQTVAVLQQLPAQVGVHLEGREREMMCNPGTGRVWSSHFHRPGSLHTAEITEEMFPTSEADPPFATGRKKAVNLEPG